MTEYCLIKVSVSKVAKNRFTVQVSATFASYWKSVVGMTSAILTSLVTEVHRVVISETFMTV